MLSVWVDVSVAVSTVWLTVVVVIVVVTLVVVLFFHGFHVVGGLCFGRFGARFGTHRLPASRIATGYRGVDIAVDL